MKITSQIKRVLYKSFLKGLYKFAVRKQGKTYSVIIQSAPIELTFGDYYYKVDNEYPLIYPESHLDIFNKIRSCVTSVIGKQSQISYDESGESISNYNLDIFVGTSDVPFTYTGQKLTTFNIPNVSEMGCGITKMFNHNLMNIHVTRLNTEYVQFVCGNHSEELYINPMDGTFEYFVNRMTLV